MASHSMIKIGDDAPSICSVEDEINAAQEIIHCLYMASSGIQDEEKRAAFSRVSSMAMDRLDTAIMLLNQIKQIGRRIGP